MRYFSLRLIFIITILSFAGAPVLAETGPKEKKKYPHPHALHSEIISSGNIDLSAGEIKDWPSFLKNLQSRIKILPLSHEARIIIGGFKPENLGTDEKLLTINEMNKLISDEQLMPYIKKAVVFGAGTIRAESEYRKTKDREDLRWLNRSIIADIFPQIERKTKLRELTKITCTTCHESYAPIEKELKEAAIDERTVMDCFSLAIKGEKMMDECVNKANMLKRSKIEDYGPLRNFVQRTDTKGEIPFFVAVHPEDPYTFKPLLKKLICIECHGQDRKVTRIRGSDGKMKDIPVFYGLGSDKPRKEPRPENKKDEN